MDRLSLHSYVSQAIVLNRGAVSHPGYGLKLYQHVIGDLRVQWAFEYQPLTVYRVWRFSPRNRSTIQYCRSTETR